MSSRLAGTLVAARIMMRGCIELSSISVDLMRASISLFALNFDRKSVKLLTSMSIKVIADHDLQMVIFNSLIPLLPRAIAFMVLIHILTNATGVFTNQECAPVTVSSTQTEPLLPCEFMSDKVFALYHQGYTK